MATNGFAVVGAVESVDQLLRFTRANAVDVALVGQDTGHDDLEGAIGALATADVASLVVSSRPLDAAGSRLLLAGASGYLCSDADGFADLPAAVEAVARGRAALPPDVAWTVLQHWRAARVQERADPGAQLSGRELEVLRAIAGGMTTRAIARRLGVAEKTVEAHRARLYSKLGARNQSHAVSLALTRGILPDMTEPTVVPEPAVTEPDTAEEPRS